MKKVLAFVLVLSMILGSFGMAFAAAPADVVGKDYEDAVNVLTELGVVAGYKDGTFRPENIVTRAEMATFLIKAMGLADYAVAKSDFSDMAGHWADPFVAYAASLGIVAGYADGTFKPDVTVSYDQAITMVIQALGYKGEYLVGGFPGAFVNQAKALGILKGVVSGAAGANRGDIATLLYNALDENFKRYDNEGAIQNAGGTMMDRLGAHAHYEEESGDRIEFVVDGEEEAVINLKGYQGALVSAWYNEDEEIIAVEEKTVFVTGDFVTENETTTFETADKEYSFKADAQQAGYKYFVNGAEVEDAKYLAEFTDEEGVVLGVKTSGKYITKVYSASVWDGAVTVKWDEDLADDLAENNELNDVMFVEDDNDEIDAAEFVLEGVASLDKIAEDDIVTYYVVGEGEAARVVKVEVSSEKVEGKITKVSGTGDDTKYTINGKQYKAALIEDEEALALGDEGTFFLNYAGKIAASEAVSEETNYAVVVKARGTEGGYDDTAYRIKLFTAEGKEVVFAMTKDAYNASSALAEGDVISYVLNADGEIKSTAKKELDQDADEYKKGLLDGWKIAEDAFVFTSEVVDGETEYDLAKVSDIPAATALESTTYLLVDNVVEVIYTTDAEEEDGIYGVVTAAGTIKNADDETVWEIDVLIDGKADTFYYDGVNFDYATTLYAFTISGDELTTMAAVTDVADYGVAYAVTAAGNIQFEKNGASAIVADDVVVYLINEDGDLVASELKKINKDDLVWMYEMDAVEDDDDKDGYDIIIYDAE